MKIKKTRKTTSIYLSAFPNEEELRALNAIKPKYRLCNQLGYTRLLSDEPTNIPNHPCTMECPIKEWFIV